MGASDTLLKLYSIFNRCTLLEGNMMVGRWKLVDYVQNNYSLAKNKMFLAASLK